MASEEVRTQVRTQLEGTYGVDGAAIILDRSPGGWSDLTTHRDVDALETRLNAQFAGVDRRFAGIDRRFAGIDRRFAELEASFDRRFAEVDRRFNALEANFDTKLGALEDRLRGALSDEFKAQTWRLIGAVAGLLAILVGAIKL